MCSVSMIGDFYNDKWLERDWYPYPGSIPPGQYPLQPGPPNIFVQPPAISREEFETLKREVADMKELLKRAKEYDAKNGEPDCEIDEKMDLLRKVAKLVGVDINDVITTKDNHL